MSIGEWILTTLSILAVIPTGVIAVETLLAVLPRKRAVPKLVTARGKCAILVPAHNEESGIARTVEALQKQLLDGDRIVVIADNCDDQTAANSCNAGAKVIERHDPEHRGKGFAIEFGLNHLELDPPDVVVLIDADTRAHPGSLDSLVRSAQENRSPVQGVFVDSPKQCGPREQWSAFALTFKNLVRPLGLFRLGLPCLLTGSGMAFPWQIIRKVQLGSGNIVEDMQLGIDLAVVGHAPRFCPEAYFESDDAPSVQATAIRRTRWEHGHMFTLLTQVPRLFAAGLVQYRPRLIGLALELSVPPLSLLITLQATMFAVCLVIWQLGGSFAPGLILSVGILAGIATIMTAWLIFGRGLLSPKILCLLPVYVLWKIPIYLKLVIAPQRKWVRTERKSSAE